MILVILFATVSCYLFIKGLVKEYFHYKHGIDYDPLFVSFVSDFWVAAIPYLVIYHILHISLFRFCYYGSILGLKISMQVSRYRLDKTIKRYEKEYLIVS